ncbi:MAG: hypothetical protein ACT4PU_10045 [Planctomycetota bacterium]
MSKRLITDRDVASGAVSGPIVLDEHTLITPSARDRAARMGLAVVEGGSSGRACASPTMPASVPGASQCSRCQQIGCVGQCASSCAGQGAGPGGAAVALPALPDGLYLVRIESGRPASVLPASGPGLMPRAAGLSAQGAGVGCGGS